MDTSELNNAILFISREYSIMYTDLLNTLANYSLLPTQLKSRYSKATKYKNPAVRLLAEKMVELNIVPSVSPMTVCNTLKKMNLSLTKANTGKYRQTKTPAFIRCQLLCPVRDNYLVRF